MGSTGGRTQVKPRRLGADADAEDQAARSRKEGWDRLHCIATGRLFATVAHHFACIPRQRNLARS